MINPHVIAMAIGHACYGRESAMIIVPNQNYKAWVIAIREAQPATEPYEQEGGTFRYPEGGRLYVIVYRSTTVSTATPHASLIILDDLPKEELDDEWLGIEVKTKYSNLNPVWIEC